MHLFAWSEMNIFCMIYILSIVIKILEIDRHKSRLYHNFKTLKALFILLWHRKNFITNLTFKIWRRNLFINLQKKVIHEFNYIYRSLTGKATLKINCLKLKIK